MPDDTKSTKDDETVKDDDKAKDDLGPGGKAALEAERKARRDAEKEAARAKKRADDLEAEKLSDTEKLQAKAARGDELAATATQKLRKANLLLALGAKGLTGAKAKAAARLLDNVEYDDTTDEPTNLDARITAAKAEFGDDVFKAAKADSDAKDDAKKGDDKAAGNDDRKDDTTDTHAGARRDAGPDEDESRKLDQYVRQSFPGLFAPDNEAAGV